MAVTIVGRDAKAWSGTTKHPEVQAAQMEVFGRLRMTRKHIADYYGLTGSQIGTLLRRPDLKNAYDKGRAETVVAVRQRQLQIALGNDRTPPNVQMLIHVGHTLGDLPKDGVSDEEIIDFAPERFSWGDEMKNRLLEAQRRIEDGVFEVPDEG